MEPKDNIAIYWVGGQFIAAKRKDVDLLAVPEFLEQLRKAELHGLVAAVEHANAEETLGQLRNELIITQPLGSPAQPLRFRDKASSTLRLVPEYPEPWMQVLLANTITLVDPEGTEMSWDYLARAGGWLPKEIRTSPKFGLRPSLRHIWLVPQDTPFSQYIRFDKGDYQ